MQAAFRSFRLLGSQSVVRPYPPSRLSDRHGGNFGMLEIQGRRDAGELLARCALQDPSRVYP